MTFTECTVLNLMNCNKTKIYNGYQEYKSSGNSYILKPRSKNENSITVASGNGYLPKKIYYYWERNYVQIDSASQWRI